MTRILDRYIVKELGPPFAIGVGDDFIQLQNAPDTMSFLELRACVARLRDGGHRVTRYLVQLYSKLSFPLVHVIMALVAIPFALVSPRSGGRAMGIGVTIVIAVGYWVVHSVALAFARPTCYPPRSRPGPPTSSSRASAPRCSSAPEPKRGQRPSRRRRRASSMRFCSCP